MGQQDRTVASGQDDLFVRSLHLKSVREAAREVDFICSTSAIDSYGEIVDQSWDLRRYATNPVVLWAHNSRDLPIGQARNVGVVDGALQATIYFSKANPEAETIWQLVLEKTLRSVSVGFIPNTIRVEKRDGEDVFVLCDNELYEISVTSIPANPEALAKMKARALQSALPMTTTTAPVGATDGGKPEASMDHEKAIAALNATISQRSAELVDTKSALDSERTKTAELTARLSATEARNASLEGVAKDLAERAAAAELTLVSRDLDALIGTKMVPAEKDGVLELARLSLEQKRAAEARGERFDETHSAYAKHLSAIKGRPSLNLLDTKSVLGNEGDKAPPIVADPSAPVGAGFDALVRQHAFV